MKPRTSAVRLAPLALGLLLPLAGCSTLRTTAEQSPRGSDAPGVDTRPEHLVAPTEPAEPPATLPGRHTRRVGPFCFHADGPLDADEALLDELARLREQLSRQLRLPEGSAFVQVYLFEDRGRYERYMQAKYAGLPRRRAFFVQQPKGLGAPDDLMVYTWRGEHLRQDLRHELTHALLHSVLKDVPLWLDEGLAEYFELPPENEGLNAAHLRDLRYGPRPDLARLEGFTQVAQMERAEYREAWAWVHLMLHGSQPGRDVLLAYLQTLRTNPNPGPLLPKLKAAFDDPGVALRDHLNCLAALTRN